MSDLPIVVIREVPVPIGIVRGVVGAKGDTGDAGAAGAQGPKGDTGDAGAAGAQGPKGDTGDAGAAGAQGSKGDTGDAGAPGAQGQKGDTGDAGAPGAQGPKGDTGDVGAAGAQGPKGDTGDVGAAGAQGPKGDTGDVGAAGAQGPKGDTGDTGTAGAQGPKGDTGDVGATGAIGPNVPLRLVDLIPAPESPIFPAGSYTVGSKFIATRAASCTGISFYAAHPSGSKTYRCKLWNAGGNVLASVDVSASALAKVFATFSSPVNLTAGTQYYVSAWAIDGSGYAYSNTNPHYPFGRDNQAFYDGGGMIYINRKCYNGGDAVPSSTASGTEYYSVSPVYVLA